MGSPMPHLTVPARRDRSTSSTPAASTLLASRSVSTPSSRRPARRACTKGTGRDCSSASSPASSEAFSGKPPARAPRPDLADHRASVLAHRLDPEDVFVLADRCIEADYHVGRNVYLPLIFDSLMHDLAKVINPKGK